METKCYYDPNNPYPYYQPERIGNWQIWTTYWVNCPKCGQSLYVYFGYKYCPYC